jgi:hypothetical protein
LSAVPEGVQGQFIRVNAQKNGFPTTIQSEITAKFKGFRLVDFDDKTAHVKKSKITKKSAKLAVVQFLVRLLTSRRCFAIR